MIYINFDDFIDGGQLDSYDTLDQQLIGLIATAKHSYVPIDADRATLDIVDAVSIVRNQKQAVSPLIRSRLKELLKQADKKANIRFTINNHYWED